MDYYLIISVLIVLNVYVTMFLARRNDLDSFQKKAQILIIWLVPFIGAIAFWFINRSHDTGKSNSKEFGGGANPNTENIVDHSND